MSVCLSVLQPSQPFLFLCLHVCLYVCTYRTTATSNVPRNTYHLQLDDTIAWQPIRAHFLSLPNFVCRRLRRAWSVLGSVGFGVPLHSGLRGLRHRILPCRDCVAYGIASLVRLRLVAGMVVYGLSWIGFVFQAVAIGVAWPMASHPLCIRFLPRLCMVRACFFFQK